MKKKFFPTHKNDWNESEKNNEIIARNRLLGPHNTKEIKHANKSKHNLSRENQVILLMNTDSKNYFVIKSFSALLKRITSKHKGGFYCLNCPHSYSTKDIKYQHKVPTIIVM